MKKTGIFSWYGYYNDYEQRLKYIKNAGFDGIMIWWEDEIGKWPISRFDMVKKAEDMNLEIFNIHMSGYDDNLIWSEDTASRQKHLDAIKKTITEIADMGIHNLVLHLCEKGDIPKPSSILLKSMEELIPVAKENQVTLSLENTWRSDYLKIVWDTFSEPILGFCFDTSHANLRAQFDLLEQYQHRLSAYHLSDNDGVKDRHWLPFDGEINFNKVMPFMTDKEIPYTMELIADQEKYPKEDTFLVEAKKRLEQLIGLI